MATPNTFRIRCEMDTYTRKYPNTLEYIICSYTWAKRTHPPLTLTKRTQLYIYIEPNVFTIVFRLCVSLRWDEPETVAADDVTKANAGGRMFFFVWTAISSGMRTQHAAAGIKVSSNDGLRCSQTWVFELDTTNVSRISKQLTDTDWRCDARNKQWNIFSM